MVLENRHDPNFTLNPNGSPAGQAVDSPQLDYLQVLDKLPPLMWRAGPDTRCDYVNQSWQTFTGRTLEQELGEGWIEGVHSDDVSRVLRAYLEAFRLQHSFEVEFRLRHYSGEYRWILCIAQPLTGPQGEFAGYIGTCYDLTERKNMERALKESEAMFKGLFDYAPDAVIVVDNQGKILLLNRQAQEMFGYSAEEAASQPIELLMPESMRDRHRGHVAGFMAEPRLRPMGACLVLSAMRKDGSLFPVDITLSPLETSDGKIVLATVRDVTERKQAEEALRKSEARFHTIFDDADLGIQLIDLDGRLVESNPAFQEMLGFTVDDLRGLPAANLLHAGDKKKYQKLFRSLLKGRRDQSRTEVRYLHADGSSIWGRLVMSLFRGEDGQPQYVINMVENITAQKQMESELAEVQRRMIDSVENERLHLAQELHDGPLQDLQFALYQVNALQDAVSGEEDESTLQDVRFSLHQVMGMLRAICGELRPPALAPFGLEKAIRSHAERFQEVHPDLTIHLDLMEDSQALPERVRLALFRIYQHVIANVARHSQATRAEIHFSFDADQITLSIRDNGRGFQVPRRWVDMVRKGHFGLVGSIERAEAVGGYFGIESAPDAGTLIRVVVPGREELQIAPRERFSMPG